MKVKYLFIIFFLLAGINAEAQKEANFWYFGDRAGLNFNSGSPVALTNSAMSYPVDGCTTVSDSNGNLLFYSNGVTVWNRNHVPMPNGFGLMGHLSSSQSVVALPKPGSSTIYFLFTVDAIENNLAGGLRYSILDMSLANGFGDITVKNVLLETPVTENLTATKHANGIDFWIITHRWNSNAYTAYQLTSNGVTSSPVVSNAGVSVQGSILNATGILKASPDGNKLGHGIRDLQLFQLVDFNKNTGVISNAIASPSIYPISVGIEFSPDCSKLYASSAGNNRIYQFNLTASNVFATGQIIATSGLTTSHLQLGPDNKIYCSQRDSPYLGVINNPNALGSACNYVNNGIYLAGKKSWFALPNFPTNLFKVTVVSNFNFSVGCLGDTIAFSIPGYQPGMIVNWDFGDPGSGISNTSSLPNASHVFSNSGSYQVTLTVNSNGHQDVIVKSVVVKPLPVVNLGRDTILCSSQSILLGLSPASGSNYKWQDGSTASTLLVKTSGTYTLEVTQNGCKAVDSINVYFKPPVKVDLGKDTVLCLGETITLGMAALPGRAYKWQNGSSSSTFFVDKPGTYILEVTEEGCVGIDSVKVNYLSLPEIDLGNDSVLCEGRSLVLGKEPLPGLKYQWQDGSTNSTFLVTQPGIYKLKIVHEKCGELMDEIEITSKKCEFLIPNIITPDGDGFNETFSIRGPEPGEFHLQIFNRWGTLVYESKSYLNNWNGESVSGGIFYYLLIHKATGKTYKGWLEVVK